MWAHLKPVVMAHRPLQQMINRFTGNLPKIFVYHRFAPIGLSIPHRVTRDTFAWQLDTIMQHYEVITLGECIARFRKKKRWPPGCVVLTIDDGYSDMYKLAWPELAKRKLPATLFATTAFVDRTSWLWPDRLEYALRTTNKEKLVVQIGGSSVTFSLGTESDKLFTWKTLSNHCIEIRNTDKWNFIDSVEKYLDVFAPVAPTEEYAAVTWNELQEMAESGIEIGSHTVNHPILSKIDLQEARKEIVDSKQVLEEKLGQPVRTFCYPNSAPGDITADVVHQVEDAGYIGAVFGMDLTHWTPYEIPRMGVSNDRNDFLAKLAGLELAGLMVKRIIN